MAFLIVSFIKYLSLEVGTGETSFYGCLVDMSGLINSLTGEKTRGPRVHSDPGGSRLTWARRKRRPAVDVACEETSCYKEV